jgi:excisionase family DNA binding protein
MSDLRPIAVGLDAAASMIGVRPRTLRKWASEGRLPSIRAGGRLLFRMSALEDFLNQHERPARNGPGKQKGDYDQPTTTRKTA